jgi:hypothetical protein
MDGYQSAGEGMTMEGLQGIQCLGGGEVGRDHRYRCPVGGCVYGLYGPRTEGPRGQSVEADKGQCNGGSRMFRIPEDVYVYCIKLIKSTIAR